MMRDWREIEPKIMWVKNPIAMATGIKCGYINIPTGIRASLCVGKNEFGWEHVSIELFARRLPTWEEMCFIKNLFWDEEETVIQMHPKKSHYVDLAEALHLWRPVNGDWSLMNKEDA